MKKVIEKIKNLKFIEKINASGTDFYVWVNDKEEIVIMDKLNHDIAMKCLTD